MQLQVSISLRKNAVVPGARPDLGGGAEGPACL